MQTGERERSALDRGDDRLGYAALVSGRVDADQVGPGGERGDGRLRRRVAGADGARAEVVGDRDALEAESFAEQAGGHPRREGGRRRRVVGDVEGEREPDGRHPLGEGGRERAQVAGLERLLIKADRRLAAIGVLRRRAESREVDRGAGETGRRTSADRGRGELGDRRRVVGEGPVAERAVERRDVGDREQVEVEAGRAQRLGRLARPSLRLVDRAAVADLELRPLGRQVSERAVTPALLGGDDQRRDPALAASGRTQGGDQRGPARRVGPVLGAHEYPAQLARAQLLDEAGRGVGAGEADQQHLLGELLGGHRGDRFRGLGRDRGRHRDRLVGAVAADEGPPGGDRDRRDQGHGDRPPARDRLPRRAPGVLHPRPDLILEQGWLRRL